jgi:hypothetical protein
VRCNPISIHLLLRIFTMLLRQAAAYREQVDSYTRGLLSRSSVDGYGEETTTTTHEHYTSDATWRGTMGSVIRDSISSIYHDKIT